MSCGDALTLEFIAENTPKSFYNQEYRRHRTGIVLSQERSLLPTTQHLVEALMESRQYENELSEIKDEEGYLVHRLREIRLRRREIRYNQRRLETGGENVNVEKKRKAFIKGCSNGECRGFLSSAYKCGTCQAYACPDCHVTKNGRNDENHVCDENTKLTVALLAKETKPCPKCAVPIYKVSGCFAGCTPVLKWDGTIETANNIKVNDELVGDDGTRRIVLELTHGEDDMYIVTQSSGMCYTVNSQHQLSLKRMSTDTMIEIIIVDYMKLPSIVKNDLMGINVKGKLSNVTVKRTGVGEYFGWKIDGNRRFLLGDTTIGHNCDQMWCQHEDTPIWMWSGEKKMAKDIVIGDTLVGDDGTPRKVEKLTSGYAPMYEVRQRFGDNYKVIGNHLLTLEEKGKNVDIKVNEYMDLPEYKRKRGYHRVAVENINWTKRDVLIDPYILGMWLGDGTSRGDGFSSQDCELVKKWVNWCLNNGMEVTHGRPYGYDIRNIDQGRVDSVGYNSMATCTGCQRLKSLCCASIDELTELSHTEPDNNQYQGLIEWRTKLGSQKLYTTKNRRKSIFKSLLDSYGLINNKNIPIEYIQNDRTTRLEILAGIIDTDGNKNDKSYRVSQCISRLKLCNQIRDVSHSLGFATTQKIHTPQKTIFPSGKEYNTQQQLKIRIMGNVSVIPVVLKTKQITEKTKYPLSTITIVNAGDGRYVGWELSGENHRYLFGDGTVTHNCVECKTPFSWTSGLVVSGVIHNPHYYQWQRAENGGVAPRVAGDRPELRCGGLPWMETITHVLRARNHKFHGWQDCHRLVPHIRQVVMPRYPVLIGIDDHTDLRIKFLMNDIDEKYWFKTLQMRVKKHEKNREVHQLLELLTVTLTDLFTTYADGSTNSLEKSAHNLRNYVNVELLKVKKRYNNTVPFISKKWDCVNV